MKKLTLLCVMAGLCLWAKGQKSDIHPLKVGDQVPDIVIENVHNYPVSKIRLSDLSGKLVILDFWGTSCINCIKEFPELYKLQREFSDVVIVILVNSRSTRDGYEKAKNFLKSRSAAYQFPAIMMDTILEQMFPHETISHTVWVKDNKVVAITDTEKVTKENIAAVLEGKSLQITTPIPVDYAFTLPLFENNNGGTPPGYLYKSFLTPYKAGLNTTMFLSLDEQVRTTRITFTNYPLLNLYRYAYPELSNSSPAISFFEVANPSVFTNVNDTINRFCYEAIFPACSSEDALVIMRADLKRYFGYGIEAAVREKECWVLTAPDSSKIKHIDTTSKRETNLFEHSGLPIYISNYSVEVLTNHLEQLYEVPFLNDTRLNRGISLWLPSDLKNIDSLCLALAEQGFIMRKECREVPVIIITDK